MTPSTSDPASILPSPSAGRRGFLRVIAPAGLALAAGCSRTEQSDMISYVIERLALRQALIERIMVIYDEIAGRLDRDAELPREALAESSNVIVQGSGELQRIEEELIFPRVEPRAPAGLIAALRCQHAVAGRMAAEILRTARAGGTSSSGERMAAADLLRSYTRIYRPHLAREATVIYPLLRPSRTAADAELLATEIGRREHPGGPGVTAMIATADAVERMLGISDIAFYTGGVCE